MRKHSPEKEIDPDKLDEILREFGNETTLHDTSQHFKFNIEQDTIQESLRVRQTIRAAKQQTHNIEKQCDYCDKPLDTVYTTYEHNYKCCSFGCLALLVLNTRIMSWEQWVDSRP